MQRLADGLYGLRGLPPYAINVYLMGEVLVDAGTRFAARRILRQVRGRRVSALALTHAHPDHQGSAHAVCEALGVPLWCGAGDAEAVEDPATLIRRLPRNALTRAIGPLWTGPAHPVARRLREGDDVGGGFVVIETPGHCAGHLSFWREADRVLVLGDVASNFGVPGLTRLGEPPALFSPDPAENRRSARKVAALGPSLICFGHGPPLRDASRFEEFVARLATD